MLTSANEILITAFLVIACVLAIVGIVLLCVIIRNRDNNMNRYYILRVNAETGKMQIKRYKDKFKQNIW